MVHEVPDEIIVQIRAHQVGSSYGVMSKYQQREGQMKDALLWPIVPGSPAVPCIFEEVQ